MIRSDIAEFVDEPILHPALWCDNQGQRWMHLQWQRWGRQMPRGNEFYLQPLDESAAKKLPG